MTRRDHAKKSPTQLQREIDEVLAKPVVAVAPHGKTTAEAKRELAKLRKQFEAQGGRGVDLAERIDALDAYLGNESIQESEARKEDWLRGAKRRFPIGARVRVVASDVPEYIGAKGTVIGHDIGDSGSWPLVSVKFDAPIRHEGSLVQRDGFYGDGSSDDEIVRDRSGKSTKSTHATVARRTLSDEQLAALRTFARANGRSWKSHLNDAWSTGNYHRYSGTDDYGSLQQVRNQFGPSWLVRFSFDKPKTHSAQL